jgi:hypothetical protein
MPTKELAKYRKMNEFQCKHRPQNVGLTQQIHVVYADIASVVTKWQHSMSLQT